MSCEPKSCSTTAAPLRPYAQQSATAETVEGVPLFFGSLPPTEAQRIANGHVAEVMTTPIDVSPDTPLHATSTMTVASTPSRNPFRRNFGPAQRAALREELIGAPMDRSASTGEKVGVVVRDTALFPLRLVRFAVALPFRAVYVAHDCVSHAISSDKK